MKKNILHDIILLALIFGGIHMNKNIIKPSTLPGFMELLPREQILFNKMLDIIRKIMRNLDLYQLIHL